VQGFSAIAMDDDDRVLLAGFRSDLRTYFFRDVVELWKFQNFVDDEDDINDPARTIVNGSIQQFDGHVLWVRRNGGNVRRRAFLRKGRTLLWTRRY
jgi:hypothetical protein